MKILIVSATPFEVKPLLDFLSVKDMSENFISSISYKSLSIDVLITGVGMTATAFYLGKTLNNNYQLVVNAGICGSFNSNLALGEVVNVYEDCFAELGAEDDKQFLSLEELNLNGVTSITNNRIYVNDILNLLPKVNGITVNTVHGDDESIERAFKKFHPIVESMEGAAFMMACSLEQLTYIQIRAVSNYVERRNRANWNIPLAIQNLNKKLIELLNVL